jgi:hypothetical protein
MRDGAPAPGAPSAEAARESANATNADARALPVLRPQAHRHARSAF